MEKTSETLRIPAKVNMTKGMIELVACASGGKLHESIFLAHIEPYHLHLALLLMGLKPKGGVQFQGDATTPEGDRVVVFVEYQNTRRRVEDYIWDLHARQPMERTEWVFAGSKFINGEYGAQLTRTLMTTYHDPYTIIDNPLPTGADDEVYEVNTRVVPPVGTTVTLVIRPARVVAGQGGKK
ncbi:MAG: YdjY domain-containing protein [Candidatus Sumerlaeia bacterium]|nr:YdjY domain-containing protein [Candidatus Sumerlaeia bacterium]